MNAGGSDAASDERRASGAQAGSSGRGFRLELDDIHFGYDPNRPVLKGVSLTVERGQVSATCLQMMSGRLQTWNGWECGGDLDADYGRSRGSDPASLLANSWEFCSIIDQVSPIELAL